jgi:O-antigen/teichoic acid export membrane protein
VIFTESFLPADSSLKLLFIASIAMFLRHGLMMTLILDERSRSVVALAAAAVIVNVVANLAVTPQFGVMGMAGAKLGADAFMVAAGGYLWFVKRRPAA